MKKYLFPVAFLALVAVSHAQVIEEDIVEIKEQNYNSTDYNKWSVELYGGVNKAVRPFSSGYYTSTPSFFHVDLGVRYMFNSKFGLKITGGYNKFKNADKSHKFDTEMYSGSLEGVANLGRIMSFETWTNTFGLLAHAGVGVSALKGEDLKKEDAMGHFILGVTPQVRLSNRFVLGADISGMVTSRQDYTFDSYGHASKRGVQGLLFTGSIGLTYYIGKNQIHADWYSQEGDYNQLEERIDNIEEMLKDDDNDGVPNYLDLEPNSAPGAMVDTRGRTIDSNGNGIPDNIEKYIADNCNCSASEVMTDNNILKALIDSGIINVYFDYNKSTPFSASVGGIDFIVQYMKMNPKANVEIIGYADPVGGNAYNKRLSQQRADAVKKIIEDKGISASRLTAKGEGIDTEFSKSSTSAYQLARRVIFRVK